MNESWRPGVDGAGRLDNRTDTLTIEETVDGFVWAEGFAVTIAATATILGDIHARQITVFGTVSGTLEASVRVRPAVRPRATFRESVLGSRAPCAARVLTASLSP